MSQIREVKDATNIVEIIGERIKLDASGANFRGLCPFHGEKTPSFFVNPALQRYRCFGCGANGDALDFLQNFEGATFYESLKTLADRAGVTLKDFQRTSEDEQRETLLEILSLAKEYYHYILTEHTAGEVGRAYLKNRGTSSESIKLFQLGQATSAWDSLLNYLHKKKKYPLELIEATGLIIKGRSGNYYDRFRERLMFPLKNHRGQIVGFSGRLLSGEAKEAKYINSPETSLYHKSKMLYGYSELFREIKKKEQIIVVEGEFDVISSAQIHVNHVVAIKGSALSTDHVNLCARVAKTLILSLDSDAAGIKATERAIPLVQQAGMDLRVIDLKHLGHSAKDPDELASSDPAAWRQASGASVSVYEYLMNYALDTHDPKTPDGKREIVNYLAPIFNHIDHQVEKEFYLGKLAKALNVKESLLVTDLERFGQKQPLLTQAAPATPVTPAKSRAQRNEEYLFFLLLKSDNKQLPARVKQIQDIKWQSFGFATIVEKLSKVKNFSLESFAKSLAEDLKELLMQVLSDPDYEASFSQANFDKEWARMLQTVHRDALHSEIADINQEIRQLDSVLDLDSNQKKRLDELLAMIVQKQTAIKRLEDAATYSV